MVTHRLPSIRLVPTLFFGLSILGTLAAGAPAGADEPIDEGTVEFEITYEDVGPMAAVLPKTERVLFRPGQVRVESGTNVTLRGVVDGKQVNLVSAGGMRIAFLIPDSERATRNELLRFEATDGRKTVAGVDARAVDGVDREDDSNRLTYWVTDRIEADHVAIPALPGFALVYVQWLQDGLVRRTATRVDAGPVDATLFAIPDDYEQVEVESPRQIGAELRKRLGGDVQVVE
ncbi:MAG: hypothetical protein AAGF23_09885 [Acidobacteriota bacterium]